MRTGNGRLRGQRSSTNHDLERRYLAMIWRRSSERSLIEWEDENGFVDPKRRRPRARDVKKGNAG